MGPNLQDLEQAVEVEEELALDDRKLPLAFNYPRHQETICGEENESQVITSNWRERRKSGTPVYDSDQLHVIFLYSTIIFKGWRMRERMKTVSVALVICLNVGVDPPDVTKTQPCARVECWIDPAALNPAR